MLTTRDNFVNTNKKLFFLLGNPWSPEKGRLQGRLCYNPALPTY